MTRSFVLWLAWPLIALLLTPHHTGGTVRPSDQSSDDRTPNPSHSSPLRDSTLNLPDLSGYQWPTDAGTVVTSVFGEYRPMHFHAGIDISTGDVTGYKVFAMRDGFVKRIRIYPNGYGKFMIVQHADGYMTAYAHLSLFAPKLEQLVESEQQRLDQYPVDLEFLPGQYPVKQGDVIAYTGDTGIGTPHLHVEIRDPNQEPLNPQLSPKLLAQDHVRPIIAKVAVIPVGIQPEGPLNADERVLSLRRERSGDYQLPRPLIISGRSGIAVDTWDPTADMRFRRGVYSIRMFIDGTLWIECVHDRAPLENAQLVGEAYDWRLVDRRVGRFEKLYGGIGAPLPFYHGDPANGGTVGPEFLPEGEHRLRIVVADIAGNTAEVTGILVIATIPMLTAERIGDSIRVHMPDPANVVRLERSFLGTSGRWTKILVSLAAKSGNTDVMLSAPVRNCRAVKITAIGRWGQRSVPRIFPIETSGAGRGGLTIAHDLSNDILQVRVSSRGIFTIPPSASLKEGDHDRTIPLFPLDVDSYQGSVHLNPLVAGTRRISVRAGVDGSETAADDSFAVYPILPGGSGDYLLDGGALAIHFDSTSVYSPLFLQVESVGSESAPAYALSPRLFVLADGLTVRLRTDSTLQHSSLFFRNRAALRFLSKRSAGDGGVLRGRLTQTLGTLSVRPDTTPPRVGRLSIRARRNRPASIDFRITDNLSGVEYESLKLYIDSTPVIPYIDGEHRRVQYQSSAPLERGSHRFMMRCSDRAGNSCTIERQFVVR